jgi:hypothetical protein
VEESCECVSCVLCVCVCATVWFGQRVCFAAVSVRSFGEVLSPKTGAPPLARRWCSGVFLSEFLREQGRLLSRFDPEIARSVGPSLASVIILECL